MTRKTLDLQKVKQIIGFDPHEKQKDVLYNATRFTTLCWGRRSGKTKLAAYVALKYLLTSNHNIWIVAPTYDLARRSWDYLIQWVPLINKAIGQFIKINKSTYTMESYAGSKLELKSTDNPASLLGAGLDMLIIDEAARIPHEVWRTHLYPTLTDRNGKALFISTPYGKNWFYDLMLKGIDTDPKYAEYSYFHMKTVENTTIPNIAETVEKAKLEMPMNDFMQEYEAEFIEGAGSVFRGVKNCLYDCNFRSFPFEAEGYNQNHVYQGGLDLARMTDFSVLTMVDKAQDCFKVVAIDRFNEIDWKVQKPRFQLMSQKYGNPRINTEKNNIGDAVISDLAGNFEPFVTTNQSKKELINNLAILIEQRKIMIPNIPIVVSELEAFSYEISASGNVIYGAPTGYHDDIVMSLAMAVKDLKDPLGGIIRQNTYLPQTNFSYDEY